MLAGAPRAKRSWATSDEPTNHLGARRDALARTAPCALGRRSRGRLSASTLVTSSIERLEAANPDLNVLAEATFDEALGAAAAIDHGKRPTGPLADTDVDQD